MINRISLRQVDAFRAVILTGSMTGAGEHLGVSQPAVSRLIKDLEKAVAMELFMRHGNQLLPTSEALLLFHEVERSFNGLEQIRKSAEEIRGLRAGSLRIAAMAGLSLGYLTKVISEFLSHRPSVALTLHSDSSQNIRALVSVHQFDIGIGAAPMEHPGVDVEPLPTLQAMCVLPFDHRLARQRVVRADQLQGVPLLCLGANSLLRMRMDAVMMAEGVQPQIRFESNLGYSLCALVGERLGIAIVDPFTAMHPRHPHLKARPLRPAIQYESAVVLPAHRPRSKLVDEFLKVLVGSIRRDFRSLSGR